jgi:hypothetical protein
MQARLLMAAGACLAVAVASGIADWRRARRRDLDRVGVVPWPTLQFVALLGTLLCAALAFA